MPVPAYCYIVATNTIHASDDNLARIRYSSQFSQSQFLVGLNIVAVCKTAR
jgi:hypothetical protein